MNKEVLDEDIIEIKAIVSDLNQVMIDRLPLMMGRLIKNKRENVFPELMISIISIFISENYCGLLNKIGNPDIVKKKDIQEFLEIIKLNCYLSLFSHENQNPGNQSNNTENDARN